MLWAESRYTAALANINNMQRTRLLEHENNNQHENTNLPEIRHAVICFRLTWKRKPTCN